MDILPWDIHGPPKDILASMATSNGPPRVIL